MNIKKISMILLLIAFVAVIGVAVSKINDKTIEESSKIANNEQSNSKSSKSDIIEITDKYFIEATNDVYLNLDDYIGKTIKMQGLIYVYEAEGETCYAVVRNTPGCCGNDGLAGLDIKYEGECPAQDTWVEIVGVVDKEKWLDGYNPIVNVTSMVETEVGETFVAN